MEQKTYRARRLVAFLIDLMIIYLPCALSTAILEFSVLGSGSILFILIAVFAFFVIFTLRDYLFHGHSIGKRILKLKVVDADTLSEPSGKQLIVKSLFFFLCPFDNLFLIVSGRSLGERASSTIVLHERQLPCTDSSDGPAHPKVSAKKRIAVAVTAVLCISIFMFSFITTALNAVKKQENYQIAYAYLINSNAYAKLGADESQITLTGYSSKTQIDSNGDAASTAVTFSFLIRGQQHQVVCHQDNHIWYVCSDCTNFQ